MLILLPDPPLPARTSGSIKSAIIQPFLDSDGIPVPFTFTIKPSIESDINLKRFQSWKPQASMVFYIVPKNDLDSVSVEVKDWRTTWAEVQKTAAAVNLANKKLGK